MSTILISPEEVTAKLNANCTTKYEHWEIEIAKDFLLWDIQVKANLMNIAHAIGAKEIKLLRSCTYPGGDAMYDTDDILIPVSLSGFHDDNWPDISFQHLNTVLAAAEEGNEVAEAIFIALNECHRDNHSERVKVALEVIKLKESA